MANKLESREITVSGRVYNVFTLFYKQIYYDIQYISILRKMLKYRQNNL